MTQPPPHWFVYGMVLGGSVGAAAGMWLERFLAWLERKLIG